ncbi:MAG: hypothetical protein CVT66_03295 [Actinobacteria bacterium HGW-Actinobacteria-6]|nr:MAG: hypothetical protein CVT66_03295 [Actinobacteria bacterium HGW-Actinobacteria-6]
MSELEPLAIPETAAPSRGRQILGRVLLGFGWTIVGFVALGIVLYLFGGMWVRTPEMRAAYSDLVASGQQPAIERTLVVPIPGCVCHSDDPVTQAQHSTRHIRDCFTCH